MEVKEGGQSISRYNGSTVEALWTTESKEDSIRCVVYRNRLVSYSSASHREHFFSCNIKQHIRAIVISVMVEMSKGPTRSARNGTAKGTSHVRGVKSSRVGGKMISLYWAPSNSRLKINSFYPLIKNQGFNLSI